MRARGERAEVIFFNASEARESAPKKNFNMFGRGSRGPRVRIRTSLEIPSFVVVPDKNRDAYAPTPTDATIEDAPCKKPAPLPVKIPVFQIGTHVWVRTSSGQQLVGTVRGMKIEKSARLPEAYDVETNDREDKTIRVPWTKMTTMTPAEIEEHARSASLSQFRDDFLKKHASVPARRGRPPKKIQRKAPAPAKKSRKRKTREDDGCEEGDDEPDGAPSDEDGEGGADVLDDFDDEDEGEDEETASDREFIDDGDCSA